jgi:hypothetical protein
MEQVTFPIRVFKQLGVDTVVCKYYFHFELHLYVYSTLIGTKIDVWQ